MRRPKGTALALAALVAIAPAAAAEMTPACREDLAAVERNLDATLAGPAPERLQDRAARCGAIRRHLDLLVATREVFLRCYAGYDRTETLGQADVAIGLFRSALAADCTAPADEARDAPP